MRQLGKMMNFGREYSSELVDYVLALVRRRPERESQVYVVVYESKVLTYDDCFTMQNVYGDNIEITLPMPDVRMKKDAIIGVYQCGRTPVRIVSPDEQVKMEWAPGQSQPLTRGQYSMIYLHRRSPYLWRLRGDFASP